MTDEERLEILRKKAEGKGLFEKAKAIHEALHKKYGKS
jgi:hypothetical protein